MRIAGERADGAKLVLLGSGLAVVLKGAHKSRPIDLTRSDQLGPWTVADNSLDARRLADRQVSQARVLVSLGDSPGHPFRGNQHVSGDGGDGRGDREPGTRVVIQRHAGPKGVTEVHEFTNGERGTMVNVVHNGKFVSSHTSTNAGRSGAQDVVADLQGRAIGKQKGAAARHSGVAADAPERDADRQFYAQHEAYRGQQRDIERAAYAKTAREATEGAAAFKAQGGYTGPTLKDAPKGAGWSGDSDWTKPHSEHAFERGGPAGPKDTHFERGGPAPSSPRAGGGENLPYSTKSGGLSAETRAEIKAGLKNWKDEPALPKYKPNPARSGPSDPNWPGHAPFGPNSPSAIGKPFERAAPKADFHGPYGPLAKHSVGTGDFAKKSKKG